MDFENTRVENRIKVKKNLANRRKVNLRSGYKRASETRIHGHWTHLQWVNLVHREGQVRKFGKGG